mmetsp:Transcript_21328/g.67466  ORF Transcript_21328/g.67466 Transcript_21328/m.67466 type:complete len:164 (+) Transcript_21328:943-1434(+)
MPDPLRHPSLQSPAVCKYTLNRAGYSVGGSPSSDAFRKTLQHHCGSKEMSEAVGPIKMACPKLLTPENIDTIANHIDDHLNNVRTWQTSEDLALGVCRDALGACKTDGASSFDKLLNMPSPDAGMMGGDGGAAKRKEENKRKAEMKDPVTGRKKHRRAQEDEF